MCGSRSIVVLGELFDNLVAESPTAEIEIGGVPIGCVLDTGAETSLITLFYHEHLTAVANGLQSVGTLLNTVGVNDLDAS